MRNAAKQEIGRNLPMARGLFNAYLKLYPGKADVICEAVKRAMENGRNPEAEILMVL